MALCLGFPWEEKNPQDPPILRMHPMCQGWGGAETPAPLSGHPEWGSDAPHSWVLPGLGAGGRLSTSSP